MVWFFWHSWLIIDLCVTRTRNIKTNGPMSIFTLNKNDKRDSRIWVLELYFEDDPVLPYPTLSYPHPIPCPILLTLYLNFITLVYRWTQLHFNLERWRRNRIFKQERENHQDIFWPSRHLLQSKYKLVCPISTLNQHSDQLVDFFWLRWFKGLIFFRLWIAECEFNQNTSWYVLYLYRVSHIGWTYVVTPISTDSNQNTSWYVQSALWPAGWFFLTPLIQGVDFF